MKISNEEKRKNATEILDQIYACKTGEDLERADDILEESMMAGRIFKKAYKFLSDELDGQLAYLIDKGLI